MTSANIVGYDKAGLVNGFSLGGPCFTPVAKEAFSIQELIPVDSEGEIQYGGVFTLQTKKPGGSADENFVFLDGEEDIGEEGWPKGWYLDDFETFATKTFACGEGFLFSSTLTGATLTYSGEVLTGPIEIPVVNGFSLESNPRPVDLGIQNIIPVDSEGEVQYGGVFTLQTKKPGGSADENFVFLDGEEDIGEEGWPKGWYLDDFETFATKVFKPGDGFLFSSTLTGAKLTFAKMAL